MSAEPSATVIRLAGDLVGHSPDDPVAQELVAWLSARPRFRAWAEAHRDKIRKKLREATEPEARRDVRAELRTAHLLLADRRIDLAFEAYGSAKGGPDFTVAFRAARPFNLEVTRLRGNAGDVALAGPLVAKLRQMPTGSPNALLVAANGTDAAALDVAGTIRSLRQRADAKEEEFFTARAFAGSRGFYEHFLRLGGVFTWCEAGDGDARAAWWSNRSARIGVPEAAVRAVLALFRTG